MGGIGVFLLAGFGCTPAKEALSMLMQKDTDHGHCKNVTPQVYFGMLIRTRVPVHQQCRLVSSTASESSPRVIEGKGKKSSYGGQEKKKGASERM
jgi:hypothetical protein